MLYPALALVSMNMTFKSFAFFSPSSVDTSLRGQQTPNLGPMQTLVLRMDIPFVCQVCLVANQHNNDIITTLLSDVLHPFIHLLESVLTCTQDKSSFSYRRISYFYASKELARLPHSVQTYSPNIQFTCTVNTIHSPHVQSTLHMDHLYSPHYIHTVHMYRPHYTRSTCTVHTTHGPYV